MVNLSELANQCCTRRQCILPNILREFCFVQIRSVSLALEIILWCWPGAIALLGCKRTVTRSAHSRQMDEAESTGERRPQSVRLGLGGVTDTRFSRRLHHGNLAGCRRSSLDRRIHHFKWLSLPLASVVNRREPSAVVRFHLEPMGHARQRRGALLISVESIRFSVEPWPFRSDSATSATAFGSNPQETFFDRFASNRLNGTDRTEGR